MRRTILLTLGFGEILVAGVLLYLGYSLPTTTEVQAGFDRAERVTTNARAQVRALQSQVHTFRQLELRTLAERLKVQTHALTQNVRSQPLDFTMVGTVRDALGELASGLDGLAGNLNPMAANRLGTGLEDTAGLLEEMVAPRVGQATLSVDGVQDAETLLKELATTLRQAARGIDTTVNRWPEVQKTLARLSKLLQTAQGQLQSSLEHRMHFEETLQQTTRLADSLATVLPFVMDQLTAHLDQQDRALDEMGCSIEEFNTILPVYGRSATQLVQTGRLLTWLVAIFVLFHAVYLLSGLTASAWQNHQAYSVTTAQAPR